MNAPGNVSEFLEWVWVNACRYPGRFPPRSDEWAREAMELVADDMTDDYFGLVEKLEELADVEGTENNGDLKALGVIETHLADLDELREILDREQRERPKMGKTAKLRKKLEFLISELNSAETTNQIRASGAVIVARTLDDGTELEFDL